MRLVLAALAFALPLAALPAATALPPPPPLAHAAATKRIAVRDNHFGPKSVTIHRGSVVKWVWHAGNDHNVRGKGVHSRTKVHGSYAHRYRHRGTFTVYCSIHRDLGMKMKVHVR
jgi:plastocyanin